MLSVCANTLPSFWDMPCSRFIIWRHGYHEDYWLALIRFLVQCLKQDRFSFQTQKVSNRPQIFQGIFALSLSIDTIIRVDSLPPFDLPYISNIQRNWTHHSLLKRNSLDFSFLICGKGLLFLSLKVVFHWSSNCFLNICDMKVTLPVLLECMLSLHL